MKTIDLLVQALPAIGGWPEKVTHIGQDYDRELMFYGRGNVRTGIILDQLAVDHRKCGEAGVKITRKQYEAALAAKNEGWIDWGGGECPVSASEMVDVIFGYGGRMSTNIADCWRWNHNGTDSDIIAYRPHQPQEVAQTEAEQEAEQEADLNECIGQAPATAWSGEGLPPVGCVCERSWAGDKWLQCEIIFTGDEIVLVKLATREAAYHLSDVRFRPIRSEAERKRDEAVQALCDAGGGNGKVDEKAGYGSCWFDVYDAIAAGKTPGVKLDN